MNTRELGYDIFDLLPSAPLVTNYFKDSNNPSFKSAFAEPVSPNAFIDGAVYGILQSGNFITGSDGWRISPDGSVEFSDGVFRGTITATTGSIGGFSIGADYIRDAADSFGLASTVTGGDDVRFYAGSTFTNRATAPFRVTEAGVVVAQSGTFGGWSLNTTSIYTGVEDHSGYTANAGDLTLYSNGTDASIHAFNWYIDTSGNLHSRGGDLTGVSINGIPNDTNTDISLLGWHQNMTFSSTDFNTTAWTSGTITLSNGRTFSISSGNTGNMAALTYIYLDTGVSSTVLQTTTTSGNAVGANRILIAVAQNNADTTSKSIFQVFGGAGGTILNVDNIAANSASTNEFVSNTAQIKDLIVTNAKINDLSVAKLTAGTITSKSIVLAVSDGVGDVELRSGIASGDFSNSGAANGFILGVDDSDSNKVKFYFGNPTRNVVFDGTDLIVNGYIQSNKGAFGGDGSDGALSITSGTTTLSMSSAATFTKHYTSISITSTGALTFSNPHNNGTLIKLKSQGNVTLTSTATACIDGSELGAAAGYSGISTGTSPIKGGNGQGGTGAGVASEPGGDGGIIYLNIAGKSILFGAGAGGGDGAGSFFGGTAGTGGRGGAALVIECGGAYNFGASSTIKVNGGNGGNGSSDNVGGGGGGGGGTILVIYNTLTADSGTYVATGGTGGDPGTNSGGSGGTGLLGGGSTATGGTGGTGGTDRGGGGSGGGGAGGGNNGSNGASNGVNGGGGGGGGGGAWLTVANTEFP